MQGRTNPEQHSGLGLHLVKRIASVHDGSVAAKVTNDVFAIQVHLLTTNQSLGLVN